VVREKAAQFRRSLLHAAFTGALTGHDVGDGELPEGWKSLSMGEIGRYLNGFAFNSKTWSTKGRPIVRIQNLTGSGSDFNFFDGEIEDRYVVRNGDLLFSWSATLGVYVWGGPEAVLNQHIFKVESNIDPNFHRYLLENTIAVMTQQTHGSGMVHITKKKFEAIPIQVPPLPEQHQIVAILEEQLSRLDAALAVADTIEKRSAALRRSLLHAAFTGKLTEQWRQQAHV
jgi:type I restriction enzyme S subunit